MISLYKSFGIFQLVSLCTQLRHFWNASTEEFYLKQMEMTYLKCHWFLGNSLRSAVEDDFNQDRKCCLMIIFNSYQC